MFNDLKDVVSFVKNFPKPESREFCVHDFIVYLSRQNEVIWDGATNTEVLFNAVNTYDHAFVLAIAADLGVSHADFPGPLTIGVVLLGVMQTFSKNENIMDSWDYFDSQFLRFLMEKPMR